MAKKLTQTQKEYRKQRRRVQQAVKRLEKIGYIFDEDVVPKIPKKITKASVQRLAKITPEKLREKSEYIIGEEVVKYKTHKKEIRQEIKRIRQNLKQEQESIPKISYIEKFKEKIEELFGNIEKFKDEVHELPDSRAFYHGRGVPATFKDLMPYKSLFLSLLDDRIAENGEEEVEKLLFEHSMEIEEKFGAITYDSKEEVVDFCLNSVASILKGSPLSQAENEMVTSLSEGAYENVDE